MTGKLAQFCAHFCAVLALKGEMQLVSHGHVGLRHRRERADFGRRHSVSLREPRTELVALGQERRISALYILHFNLPRRH